jgi:predicted ATPase/DNA-binding SARP family transcriptional activator/tetratricopeptide (TPR) repeat protein
MELGVRVLGAPEAIAEGAWRPLTSTRPHAALAYLAVRGGLVRRAEVAALLWPDADAQHAQVGLRQLLRRLDRGPFGALIGRDRSGLWMLCESDAVVFRRAIAELRWADAFDVYTGPLLHGFEIDDSDEYAAWLASERATVAEDWRRACRALMVAAAAEGRSGDAARYADELTRADPLDEQAVRAAMRAAAALGDQRGVERRYEALVTLLERQTGLAPEAETEELWVHLTRPVGALAGTACDGRPGTGVGGPTKGERRGVIGRADAIADLVERLLDRETRLVTLLGPGGIGKTTLAGALVAELRSIFADGAHFVSLEGVQGPDAVALSIAQAFDVALVPRAVPAKQLARALDGRRALVVLDGFELHLDQVMTVDELLRGAPSLRLLVTSRVRLHHSQEVVVEVDPLATLAASRREAVETPTSGVSPAAQLFLRAAAARLPLQLVRRLDLEVVERVVEALGGHPLAIEIAASWIDVVGLEGLEAQVQASWVQLHSEDVDRPARRRDVLAVVQEAWEGLTSDERSAWARLAVMPGSVDRAVAAEVCANGWRGLRCLLDRALLRHDGERFRLHPLLARFGREQARAAGLEDAAWESAARVWRSRIAQQLDPRSGRRVRIHVDDLEQALGAWRWALAARDWATLADMAVGLSRALDGRMRWREAAALGRESVERLLAARGRDRDVALARLWPELGETLFERKAHAARALTLASARGDDLAAAGAHAMLARGTFTAERAVHVEAARAGFERVGDAVGLAELLVTQGGASVLAGRQAHAASLLEDARVRFERLADADGLALVHAKRGRLALHRGDLAAADAEMRSARGLVAHVGAPPFLLEVEAEIARVAGGAEQAMEAIEAYIRALSTRADATYDELLMRTHYHLRFGPPDRLLEVAGTWAAHRETLGGRLIHRMLVNLCLAIAHARLGAPARARAPLALAIRLARPLEVPRIVAAIVTAAATVAAARGEGDAARRLLRLALRHPALEYEWRLDAEALCAASAGGGAVVVVDADADSAPPSDASILDEAEGWLAGWVDAGEGVPL